MHPLHHSPPHSVYMHYSKKQYNQSVEIIFHKLHKINPYLRTHSVFPVFGFSTLTYITASLKWHWDSVGYDLLL